MIPKQTNTAARSSKKCKRFLIGFALLVLVGAGSLVGLYVYIMQPQDSSDSTPVEVIIPKGQSLSKTAQILTDQGLLRSPWSLKVLAYTQHAKIQSGKFMLSPSMTPADIITALNLGKLDYWVTFLEGWRREQFAEALAQAALANHTTFDQQQFLTLTQEKEGLLFPDTYLFPLDASVETIIATLESTMDKKFTPEMQQHAVSLGRNKHQILTMASLVEREAKTDSSRRIVAGILWKRLANNWPLQVDATLQYIKGYNAKTHDWWSEPLATDKELDSPYNTYKYPGLPPTPICAPSLSSIQAAVYPQESDYWYYLSDVNGTMHYAKDLIQHNQNINQYLR